MTRKTPGTGAYIRRSKARKEHDRNASLAEQRAEIHERADRDARPITEVYDEGEGVSASRFSRQRRPEWERALGDLRSGTITTLYVYEMSRAERRGALDGLAGELIDRLGPKGRALIVVDRGLNTSDPNDRDRCIRYFEDAREEAERLSKRVRRTKLRRRADGAWVGSNAPFGMAAERDEEGEPTGRVVRSPDWPTARRIAEDVLAGKSMRALANDLTAEGVPTMKGGLWKISTLQALVTSPTWAGLQTADRRRAEGDGGGWHNSPDAMYGPDGTTSVQLQGGEDARVITPAERDLILARFAANTRETGRFRVHASDGRRRGGRKPSTNLLAGVDGVLRCGLCGGPMQASGTDRAGDDDPKGRTRKRAYRCSGIGYKTCVGTFITRFDADEYIVKLVHLALHTAPDDSPLWLTFTARLVRHLHPESGARQASAQAALDDARAELLRIQNLAVAGILTAEEASPRVATARQAIAAAERQVKATAAEQVTPTREARSILDRWDTLDLQDRRAVLAAAIDSADVQKVGRAGRNFPMHERILIDGPVVELLDSDPEA